MGAKYLSTMTSLILLIFTSGLAVAKEAESEKAVLEPVTKRIQSFNEHNLDSYLAAHKENVRIFEFPDKAIGVGRSHLKRIFGPLFERGVGSVEVVHQVVIDNRVISEELLSFGSGPSETVVAVYTIDHGLISSIYLVESEH